MLLLIGFAAPAVAQKNASKPDRGEAERNFVSSYVAGMILEEKCPTWRQDRVVVSLARSLFHFEDDVFQPGGRLHNEFMQQVSFFRGKVGSLDRDWICDLAEQMFGPKGAIFPGWMKRR